VGGREDLDGALKAIMAAKREELGEPPTPEELLAYHDGTLDPAAREELEARLAVYPDAARTLADIAAFPNVEPAPGTTVLSEEEVEARWQGLKKILTPFPSPIALPTPGRGAPPPSLKLQLAAAASLALVVGAVGGFFLGRAFRPSDSAVNVAVAELAPVEEGARAGARDVELPRDSEELLLVLGLPADADFPKYRAEILNAGGARVWAREGLRPTPLGTLHLSFRRGALAPGMYRVRLYAQAKTPVAAYDLRLVAE
jgi:hypothetical protein